MSEQSSPILKKGFLFWCLPALGAVFFIWLFQSVLLPFVIGIALAYLLNPVVNALHKAGIGRPLAALLILLLFIVAALVALAFAVPFIISEAQQFWAGLPALLERGHDMLAPYIGAAPDAGTASLPQLLSGSAGSAASFGKTVLGTLAAGGAFVTSIAMVTLLATVVAYFMIKQWPAFIRFLEDLIPPRHRKTVLGLFSQMDRKIAGFVRGQLLV
ncbi:MAG TPA: AI-2E family transporter, partial [Alphaproteobacteria bacterium]|nr:AI-2E family transporter [Alphaproteobacteria bacterium]